MLLWHVETHYLYRCSKNISCDVIDHSLYICNASLRLTTTADERTDTTSAQPVVSTTESMIFSTSTSLPVRTSTPPTTIATTLSQHPSTTTRPPLTSTFASTTLPSNLSNQSTTTETAQRIESLENHTTTDSQSQNLSTTPFVSEIHTSTYTSNAVETTTTEVPSSTLSYTETQTTQISTTTVSPTTVTFVNTPTTTYIQPDRKTTTLIRTTTVGTITSIQTSTTKNYTRIGKLSRGELISEQAEDNTGLIVVLVFVIIFSFLTALFMVLKKRRKRVEKRDSTVLPTEEPLDPAIEKILEEQDLKNQLRINSWRMTKLHKYLKKKYPEKSTLAESMEKEVALMEKIHIQIKNSPVQIYKKRGSAKKKKETVPTMTVDILPPKKEEIPTIKVDLMTSLKEPEKVKHISSVAKLRIKMLPAEYEHRRKRRNFTPLKKTLLPVQSIRRPRRKAPEPPKSLEQLKEMKLVSNSVFKKS